jgi:hypothetical protein
VTDQSGIVSGPTAPANTTSASPGGKAALAAKVQDRPELAIGGAFAGGLVLALILKRLAG